MYRDLRFDARIRVTQRNQNAAPKIWSGKPTTLSHPAYSSEFLPEVTPNVHSRPLAPKRIDRVTSRTIVLQRLFRVRKSNVHNERGSTVVNFDARSTLNVHEMRSGAARPNLVIFGHICMAKLEK